MQACRIFEIWQMLTLVLGDRLFEAALVPIPLSLRLLLH